MLSLFSHELFTDIAVFARMKRMAPIKRFKADNSLTNTRQTNDPNERTQHKANIKTHSKKHITVRYDESDVEPSTHTTADTTADTSRVNAPHNWPQVLANIELMRSERTAAVDTMGAEQCFDKNADSDKDKRFQVLVSLMLSSQTRDQITHSVMMRLRERGLSVASIIAMTDQQLADIIRPVGFYKKKTQYIKEVANVLRQQYDDDIPDSVEALMKLKGVGPKMAHLAMKIAWNESTGIAVDTHVHRICNRLAWVRSKTPEQTRVQFEAWLPKQHWDHINGLLVGFGQTICSPIRPKCNECLNKKLCPFGSSQR